MMQMPMRISEEDANDPNASPDALAQAAEAFPDEVARNANSNQETLSLLAMRVPWSVAENPALAFEVANPNGAFYGWRPRARAMLAGCANLPLPVLSVLVDALFSPHVRKERRGAALLAAGLLRNPNLTPEQVEVVQQATQDTSLAAWRWVASGSAEAHVATTPRGRASTPYDVIVAALKNVRLTNAVAQQTWGSLRLPSVYHDELAEMVPNLVAATRNVPPRVLVQAFRRASSQTRFGLFARKELSDAERLTMLFIVVAERQDGNRQAGEQLRVFREEFELSAFLRSRLATVLEEEVIEVGEARHSEQVLEWTAAHPFARRSKLSLVQDLVESEDPSVLVALALGYKLHPDIARLLSVFPHAAVRLALASNPDRPRSVDAALLQDGDRRVRTLAQRTRAVAPSDR